MSLSHNYWDFCLREILVAYNENATLLSHFTFCVKSAMQWIRISQRVFLFNHFNQDANVSTHCRQKYFLAWCTLLDFRLTCLHRAVRWFCTWGVLVLWALYWNDSMIYSLLWLWTGSLLLTLLVRVVWQLSLTLHLSDFFLLLQMYANAEVFI